MAEFIPIGARPSASVHTVVINLERDRARLAAVAAELARHGMAFERFAAVEGLAVPTALRGYFFDVEGHPTPTLTKGEIGCYASHLSLWQRVACGQYPDATLICEDDIRLPDNFLAVLNDALNAAPAGWDVIRLSAPSKRTIWPIRQICDGHRLVHYSKIPTLLGAYLISRRGAEKLVRPGLRTRPVDLDMARPWEIGLNLYGVDPAPVHQPTKNPSSIDAVEQRRYARRATGFFGIGSRLFGRERFARYWHNARTVGLHRAVAAELWNLFRGRSTPVQGVQTGGRPMRGHSEVFEV
jgi:glycosyl transferase family 25